MDPQQLQALLEEKLALGNVLMDTLACKKYQQVQGIAKLEKKIRQEIKFLQKFLHKSPQEGGKLKNEHLQCSNLQHLSAIVDALKSCSNPQAVLHTFSWKREPRAGAPVGFYEDPVKKVTVDVVGDGGLVWTKVVARNPKALDLNSRGGNQFGQRSIVDQVKDFLRCAGQNTKLFRAPKVVFVFHNGVSDVLAAKLTAKGIQVAGEILPSPPDAFDSGHDDDESSSDEEEDDALGFGDSSGDDGDLVGLEECADISQGGESITVPLSCPDQLDSSALNLDITAMIAYVSALTNGCADYTFKEPILSDQATWERDRPVKPVLDRLFEGKHLVCCQSAMRDFEAILKTLGGDGERTRAKELLERVEVVDDQVSPRLAHLDMSGKIKERSRAIFGTGDRLKVVTVTANSGFVRAARGQGVELAVALHESRALTEDKMLKEHATKIDYSTVGNRED